MCAGLHSTKRSPPAGPSGSRLGGRTPHPRVAGGQVAGAAGRQVDKATTAQLDYSGATFSGGTVNFSGAEFSGGTVDLSSPEDWSVPPSHLPPSAPGLLLPEGRGAVSD
jgi:hypothetical protein